MQSGGDLSQYLAIAWRIHSRHKDGSPDEYRAFIETTLRSQCPTLELLLHTSSEMIVEAVVHNTCLQTTAGSLQSAVVAKRAAVESDKAIFEAFMSKQ